MKKLLIYIFLSINVLYSNAQTRTIEVFGTGSVSVFPDAATITLNIKFIRPTLREAINETQKVEEDVIKVVKKYVSDTLEIKQGFINTDKHMVWNNKLSREVFMGFVSNQTIVFPLKDLNKLEAFTEAILKTRIQEISSVSYYNTKAESYYIKAQEEAVKEAIKTTAKVASDAGLKTGRIIYLDNYSGPNANRYNSYETESFQTYGKGMGGRGVSSTGQLIYYNARVKLQTEIVD